jgi:hypothetical protein
VELPRAQPAGLITLTRTRQVRGAVEHFYRLAVRARIVVERADCDGDSLT